MTRRALIGALVVGCAVLGVVVAMLGWSPRAHQPTLFEWVTQLGVVVAALLLVYTRITGKR